MSDYTSRVKSAQRTLIYRKTKQGKMCISIWVPIIKLKTSRNQKEANKLNMEKYLENVHMMVLWILPRSKLLIG